MFPQRCKEYFATFMLAVFLIAVSILIPPNIYSVSILLQENFNDGNARDGNPITWEEYPNSGTWTVTGGRYVGSINPGGVGPRTFAGNLSWDDYAIEATITGISGVDRHIFFRFDPNRIDPQGYAIKYREANSGVTGLIELQKAGVKVLSRNTSFIAHTGESHRIRVEGVSNRIKVYADGIQVIDYIDSDPILTGKVGFFVEPSGIGLINTTAYDDILVEDLSVQPSPTPAPTTTFPLLNVLEIKQYSEPWGLQEYDSARNWSNNITVSRWGCALTSGAMILKFYGHNVNPTILNDWLKSQPDGYLPNGNINWLALSRFSKINKNPNNSIVEYRRLDGNITNVINELNSSRPTVLKLPGHFVLAKGFNNSNIVINDPAYNRTELSKDQAILSVNQFKPSNTDLSYILIVLPSEFQLDVHNNSGNTLNDKIYLETPLDDDIDNSANSGKTIKLFLLPTPLDEIYVTDITGSGQYKVQVFIYNNDGQVTDYTYLGIVSGNNKDTIKINLTDPEQAEVTMPTSIDNIIADIDSAYAQGGIRNKGIYQSTKSLALIARKFIGDNKNKDAIRTLLLIKMHISTFTPKYIDRDINQLISNQLEILLNSF